MAVFGIGGVGSYVVEALARSGIGALDLFDSDTVALSNINRQLIALESTLGRPKVEAAKERVLQINPACRVEARQLFFTPESAGEVGFSQYDYVADAIDHSDGEAGTHPLLPGGRGAGDLLHGHGEQAGPHRLPGDCHRENQRLPPGPGHAPGAEKAGHHRGQGGVVAGGTPGPRPFPRRPEGHRGPPHPGEHGIDIRIGLILAGEIVKDLLGETLRKGGERHG